MKRTPETVVATLDRLSRKLERGEETTEEERLAVEWAIGYIGGLQKYRK